VPTRRGAAAARAVSEARRRDGRHCPVCLSVLARISGPGGAARECTRCGARRTAGPCCARCREDAVWQAKTRAACAACGHHGSKVAVIAGHAWLSFEE
jgi:hypothetical protein